MDFISSGSYTIARREAGRLPQCLGMSPERLSASASRPLERPDKQEASDHHRGQNGDPEEEQEERPQDVAKGISGKHGRKSLRVSAIVGCASTYSHLIPDGLPRLEANARLTPSWPGEGLRCSVLAWHTPRGAS
jgi:hypothetical protein